MPPVTRETLRDYHRHLSARLTFPLAGVFRLQVSAAEAKTFPLTLTGLRPADETGRYGVLAETRLEGQPCALPLADCAVAADGAARELLEDHAAWYRASPRGRQRLSRRRCRNAIEMSSCWLKCVGVSTVGGIFVHKGADRSLGQKSTAPVAKEVSCRSPR